MASVVLEAGHVAGQVEIPRIAVAAAGAVVTGGGIAEKELQVLVRVIVLFGLKTQRHAQLGPYRGIIALGRGIVVKFAAGDRFVPVLVITAVIGPILLRLDGHLLFLESAAGGNLGADGLDAVHVIQIVAVRIGQFEAIASGSPVLEAVGAVGRVSFRHRDHLVILAVREGIGTIDLNKMRPRKR